MITADSVRELLKQGRGLHEKARPVAEDLVINLRAIDAPEAKAKLTDGYRRGRRQELLKAARDAVQRDVASWRNKAKAIGDSREELTGFDAAARRARFVPTGPRISEAEMRNFENPGDILKRDEAHATSNKFLAGVVLDMLNELRTMRVRAEVGEATDRQLVTMAREATAEGNLAQAKLIVDEVSRRGLKCSPEAKSAAFALKREIELPVEASSLGDAFDEIEQLNNQLGAVMSVMLDGNDEQLRILDRVEQVRVSRESGRDPVEDAQLEIEARNVESAAAAAKAATGEVKRADAVARTAQ